MLALKRLSAMVQRVTLWCAALLLIVTSLSGRQGAEVGRGRAVQTLRQVIGLRAPNLRLSTHAPLRAAAVRKAITDNGQSSAVELDNFELACLLECSPRFLSPVGLIVEHRTAALGLAVAPFGLDVARARAPPALGAIRS